MRNRTWFRIFHGVLILFYVLMYATSVLSLKLPIYHNQLGILLALVLFGILLVKFEVVTSILLNYLKLKAINKKLFAFKLSVWLLVLHFTLTIITGLLMMQGVNLYVYHALSKYIVPVILLLHIVLNYMRKSH